MKIVFVVPNLSGGGAEFVASQWANYLAESGDTITIYSTNPRESGPLPAEIRLVNGRAGGFASQIRDLRGLIAREKPDHVVALMPFWNLLAILATTGINGADRPMVTISGRNMASALDGVFGREYRVKQWLARRIYKRADHFIAISHPVAAEAIALYGLPSDKVTVLPNPALAKLDRSFNASELQKLRQRVIDTSPSATVNIVVPARLVAQKRPEIPLRVAAKIAREHGRHVEVHYFGSGALQSTLETRATDLGIVAHFHGWVLHWFADIPPNAVVLLPSLAEGFGNVLVEAAAVGVPSVVSSRCLGSADAVVPGMTGEICAGDDDAAYAEAVLKTAATTVTGVDGWLSRFSYQASGRQLRALLSSYARGAE